MRGKIVCKSCGKLLDVVRVREAWGYTQARVQAREYHLCDGCSRLMVREYFTSRRIVEVMMGVRGS